MYIGILVIMYLWNPMGKFYWLQPLPNPCTLTVHGKIFYSLWQFLYWLFTSLITCSGYSGLTLFYSWFILHFISWSWSQFSLLLGHHIILFIFLYDMLLHLCSPSGFALLTPSSLHAYVFPPFHPLPSFLVYLIPCFTPLSSSLSSNPIFLFIFDINFSSLASAAILFFSLSTFCCYMSPCSSVLILWGGGGRAILSYTIACWQLTIAMAHSTNFIHAVVFLAFMNATEHWTLTTLPTLRICSLALVITVCLTNVSHILLVVT